MSYRCLFLDESTWRQKKLLFEEKISRSDSQSSVNHSLTLIKYEYCQTNLIYILTFRICMRMVKIENERNTFMGTDSSRRDEVSPTIIASRKILGFVISYIHLFHGIS